MRFTLLPVIAVLAAAGCTAEPVAPPTLVPVASVTLQPVGPVVGVGATAPLTATTLDAQGTVLPNRPVTYATSDAGIATVDGQGVVTGVAAGATQITATAEGHSGAVTLTVSTTPVATVLVAPPSTTVDAGATTPLVGEAFDGGGAALPGRVFAWSTSSPAIATVTSLGVVHGVAAGTATITGTAEGKSATATVTVVRPPVASVTVTPGTGTVGLGETLQLTATVKDGAGHTLTGRVVTWQTTNATAVAVSGTGLAQGQGLGDVTITATSEGVSGTASIGGRLRFNTVSAGQDFACGVTPLHTIYCWGRNAAGALGDGTTTDRATPVPVAQTLGLRFDLVSAGQDHTCAVTSTGDVYCWGANGFGQLGTGDALPRTVPTRVSVSGVTFTLVSAAAQFTCAATTTNVAYCWGLNGSGQLGNATNAGVNTPNPTPLVVNGGPFSTVSATQGHACGTLTGGGQDGIVVCWGLNDAGQLGRGGGPFPPFDVNPQTITGSVRYNPVSAGFRYTCGIRLDTATADCWGLNDFGQLGTPTLDPSQQSTPVSVSGGRQFADLSTGQALTCGVTPTGQGYCWGNNTNGQLGTGSGTPVPTPPQPLPVSGSITFTTIGAGYFHACGVSTDRVAWCWGRAQDGSHPGANALGSGVAGSSNVPVRVGGQQ